MNPRARFTVADTLQSAQKRRVDEAAGQTGRVQEPQALFAKALKRIGRAARLEGSSAQQALESMTRIRHPCASAFFVKLDVSLAQADLSP